MASISPNPGDRVIIVGVDFGTTYTGVAYADSQKPEKVHVISTWPNHAGRDEHSGKIQTKLRYLDDGTVQWGAMIPPDANEILECFKLALDPQHTKSLQNGSRLLRGNLLGQDIEKFVIDYLTELCRYVKQHLRDQISDAVVDTTPFQYVLTVPAIWSDLAKQKTVDAFAKAMQVVDTKSIYPITEPEAAAICVLQQMDRHELKAGDCFLVVDAGGGTVDLISYIVKDLYPCLSVSEAAAGSGGACGSAFLNERFRELAVQTLGQEDGFDEDMLGAVLDKWERTVKRSFSLEHVHAPPAAQATFPVVGLEDNKDLKVRSSKWTVAGPEILRVFEEVILQVLKLVTDQQVATQVDIKAVLLVGGFGQSAYLQERLRSELKNDIRILRPDNSWTAVVEGAVMRGLARVVPERKQNIKIVARKARRHYGFELAMIYSHHRHAEISHLKQFDHYSGQWEVMVMQWFIKKGNPVTESQPYTKNISVVSMVKWGRPPTYVMVTVYCDEISEAAPLSKTDNVKMLCNIEADLSQIPENQILQQQGTDGMMYYVVNCEVEISYDAASADYTLIHNGRRYNTVTAELL